MRDDLQRQRFTEWLHDLMDHAGLGGVQLAEKAGLGTATVYRLINYENYENPPEVSIATLEKIAKALEVDLAEMLVRLGRFSTQDLRLPGTLTDENPRLIDRVRDARTLLRKDPYYPEDLKRIYLATLDSLYGEEVRRQRQGDEGPSKKRERGRAPRRGESLQ